jgi:hypothetical protein
LIKYTNKLLIYERLTKWENMMLFFILSNMPWVKNKTCSLDLSRTFELQDRWITSYASFELLSLWVGPICSQFIWFHHMYLAKGLITNFSKVSLLYINIFCFSSFSKMKIKFILHNNLAVYFLLICFVLMIREKLKMVYATGYPLLLNWFYVF